MSATIRDYLKNIDAKDYSAIIVPVPEVNSIGLIRVMSWCHGYQEAHNEAAREKVIADWDAAFMSADPNMVLDVLNAAKQLAIPELIKAGHRALAMM